MEGTDPLDASFFARYRPLALRFVTGLVRGSDVAEDLFQEAACAMVERASAGELAFESQAHARNYLFRALRNLAVDRMRDPGRRARRLEGDAAEGTEPASTGPTPFELVSEADEARLRSGHMRLVEEAIRFLKPHERDCLRMRYREGLTYREMAERGGEAIATLQSRVEAALGKIRRKIGRRGGAP